MDQSCNFLKNIAAHVTASFDMDGPEMTFKKFAAMPAKVQPENGSSVHFLRGTLSGSRCTHFFQIQLRYKRTDT